MSRRAARAAILALWVASMLWLLRYEAFPEFFTHKLSGYRSLLSDDVLMRDTWMRILFQGQPIGYVHTSIETDEVNPRAYMIAKSRMFLRMNVLGEVQKIYTDSITSVDITYHLQSFLFNLSSRGYTMRVEAVRTTGSDFDVTFDTGTSVQRTQIEIPPDVVVYSPMTDLAVSRLQPGESISIRTLDPATLSTIALTVTAGDRERITVGEEESEAVVLTTDYQGAVIRSWVDGKGRTLRQETPFGWVMEMCSAEEAFAAGRGAADGEDILRHLAVPVTGFPGDVAAVESLRLKVVGAALRAESLESNRQRVERTEGNATVLTVDRARIPDGGGDVEGVDMLLRSTDFVQSAHPEIVARAAEITAGIDDPHQKVMAIQRWVYGSVKKEMTISLPSALDVLRTMRGDCNEHTYLFVALARAAGLPAKIKVGLAYQNGAFYYHAWPAVYAGDWWELDPTWGQDAVDAGHIALVEGELKDQLDLVRIIGQIRIEVLGQGTGNGDK